MVAEISFLLFFVGVTYLLCIFAPRLGYYTFSFAAQNYLIAGRLRSPFFCCRLKVSFGAGTLNEGLLSPLGARPSPEEEE